MSAGMKGLLNSFTVSVVLVSKSWYSSQPAALFTGDPFAALEQLANSSSRPSEFTPKAGEEVQVDKTGSWEASKTKALLGTVCRQRHMFPLASTAASAIVRSLFTVMAGAVENPVASS